MESPEAAPRTTPDDRAPAGCAVHGLQGRTRTAVRGPPGVQARFRLGHRRGTRAEGPERGHRPDDLAEEERARVAPRVAAAPIPELAPHEGADVGEHPVRSDRLP